MAVTLALPDPASDAACDGGGPGGIRIRLSQSAGIPPRAGLLPRLKDPEQITDFLFGLGGAFHSPADLGQKQLAIVLAQAVDRLAHGILREAQFRSRCLVPLAVFTLVGEERLQGFEDFTSAGIMVARFQLAKDFADQGRGPFPLELALGVVEVARCHPVAGFGIGRLDRQVCPSAATPLGVFLIPLISEVVRETSQQETAKLAFARTNLLEAVLGQKVNEESLDRVFRIGRAVALRPYEGVEWGAVFRAQTLQSLRCSGCLMSCGDQDFGPLGLVEARLRWAALTYPGCIRKC